MLVQVLSFGINWWARYGIDPADRYRYTRHAVYYNSTGVCCGGKIRRHWIVPGLIRFNGSFLNPHFPNRLVGHTFLCSDLVFALGGNRLLFRTRMTDCIAPDCYLVVISQAIYGRMNLRSNDWKSDGARVIAASELRQMQEVMLLMKPEDWVQTDCGFWVLRVPDATPTKASLEVSNSSRAYRGRA